MDVRLKSNRGNLGCIGWVCVVALRLQSTTLLPPPRAQGIAPLQPWRALTARRSGVPTRLRRVARRRRPAFTAVRIPRRMARPFEWATRHSRVGTDRFGTGPVGTGCGVPTRLRRVARRRAGPARPRIDDDQAFVGFDKATKLECPVEPDALKRGIVAASSPGAAPGSPRPIRKAGGGRPPRSAPSWREPPSRGRDSPR